MQRATTKLIASVAAAIALTYVGLFWYQSAVSETYCLKQQPDTGYPHLRYFYTGSKVSAFTLRAFCTWEGMPSRGMPAQVTAMADLERARHERIEQLQKALDELPENQETKRVEELCNLLPAERAERLRELEKSLAYLDEQDAARAREPDSSWTQTLAAMDARLREQAESAQRLLQGEGCP